MDREQCYILEIQNLKYGVKHLLSFHGLEEDKIEALFKHAHREAWKKYREEK